MDGFPSGQRGQTVNLLQIASVVRIHLHPFPCEKSTTRSRAFFDSVNIVVHFAIEKVQFMGLVLVRSNCACYNGCSSGSLIVNIHVCGRQSGI